MSVISVIKKVTYGVASGALYYLIYVVALPTLISSITATPIPISGMMATYFGFFVALGTAESVLEGNVVSIPLRLISKLLGALILWNVLSGGHISTTMNYGALTISVEADISILLYVVILVSLIYGFLDAFTYFSKTS